MTRLSHVLLPGRPFPLGATWDGLGINFAVFSAHAERMDLCLFEPSGRHEIARYTLPEYTDEIWHGYLPDAAAGLVYGYRVNSSRGDLSFDRRDSAPAMPKAVVVDESFNWGEDHPPAVPWSDTVI